jgi:hypothetical protein
MGLGISSHASCVTSLCTSVAGPHCTLSEPERAKGAGAEQRPNKNVSLHPEPGAQCLVVSLPGRANHRSGNSCATGRPSAKPDCPYRSDQGRFSLCSAKNIRHVRADGKVLVWQLTPAQSQTDVLDGAGGQVLRREIPHRPDAALGSTGIVMAPAQ